MKLSKITLTLIAQGLRSFADAVDNMAAEADEVMPKVETREVKQVETREEKPTKAKAKAKVEDENEDEDEAEEKETKAERQKRLRKERREKKKAEEAKKAAEDEDEDEDVSFDDEDESESEFTKDDVKKALVSLAKEQGNAAAKAILTKYKAENVSKIKEADYADVMADIEEASE